MNKLQESIIREFIIESLVLEEKYTLNEGIKQNIAAVIGLGLASFLNTSIGQAITTRQTAKILNADPNIENVKIQVAGGNRVFIITDQFGDKFTVEVNATNLLKISKQDFEEEIEKVKSEGYPLSGEISNIFDNLSKTAEDIDDISKRAIEKEDKNEEGSLGKIREKIVELSKNEEGQIKIRSFYQKNVRGQKRKGQIDIESMAFSITARRLEDEDGIDLGEYLLGRLLYVHILFNKTIKNNFIKKFKLSQQ